MAVDPAALNALTSSWAAANAELDDNENRTRINYNTLLDRMRRQNQQNMGQVSVGMADRGLTHSGIAAQAQTKVMDEHNRGMGQAAQNTNLDLATIARKRLEAQQALNANQALLQSQAYQESLGL